MAIDTAEASPDSRSRQALRYIWDQALTRRLTIVAVVFLVHLVWRLETVAFPPFWDSLEGPFVEAMWLIENNFDYKRLLLHEPGYFAGGGSIYVWSVIPTTYALLIKACQTPDAFLTLMHVANFLMAGILAMLIHELLYCHLKLPGWQALGVAAMTVLQPAFGAQIDLISMELPTALAIFTAAVALTVNRPRLAIVLVTAAIWRKASASLMAIIVLVVGLATVFLHAQSRRHRLVTAALLPLPLIMLTILNHLSLLNPTRDVTRGDVLGFSTVPVQEGIEVLIATTANLPDLYGVALLSLLLSPLLVWRCGFVTGVRQDGWCAALRQWLTAPKTRLYTIAAMAVCGCLAANVRFGHMFLVRYTSWYTAFFFIFFVLTIVLLRLSWRVVAGVIVLLLAFQLSNQYGRWLPKPKDYIEYSGSYRERSREYVSDMRALLEMSDWLAAHAGDRRVLVQAPYDVAFASPRLGWVDRRLRVVSTNMVDRTTPDIPFFLDLSPGEYHESYITHVPSLYIHPSPTIYSPHGSVKLLMHARENPQFFIYRVLPPPSPPADEPSMLRAYYLRSDQNR